jgi:disulfide bond formation protein DsbB
MNRLLTISRLNAAGLVAGIGLAMLGAALAFQYWGGLEPCNLCVEQRKAWGAAVILATLAMMADGKSRIAVAIALLALAGIAALVGAGVAAFHVGVEQQWWAGTQACGAGFSGFGEGGIADLREQLLNRPMVRCDQIAWSMLGISMAGWNGLVALATGLGALYIIVRDIRHIRQGRTPAS